MVGSAEAEKIDEAGYYCLTYHPPEGRGECKQAGLV